MARADIIVGIFGNILSILTFLAPLGTFRKILKNKSSEDYSITPYITTLLSTSLWTFYGILDPDDGLLIMTVNSVGVVTQLVYVILFIIYAPTKKKLTSISLLAVLNICVLAPVIVVTLLVFHENAQRTFIGILCATVTIGMYAAPLKVIGTVVRTKSVKYMPFFLSFFLFLNAGVWFTFALLLKDLYVLVPNAVGIVLGSGQLVIYMTYKMKSSEDKLTFEENGPSNGTEEGSKMMHGGIKESKTIKEENASSRSLSRQYSLHRSMKTLSLSSQENECTKLPHDDDIENGNIN